MAKNSILYGIILIVVGLAFYIGSYQSSITALIPGFFGVVMVLCGLLARNENIRKHLMHVAAVVALLGFIATVPGIFKLFIILSGGEMERSVAVIEMTISSVIFLIYVILAIQSFLEARRRREQ